MSDLFELLRQIKNKPGLYIGSPSISNLFMFLNGYRFARRQMNLAVSVQEQEFQEFQPWLQEKLALKSTHAWSQLILLHSIDERDAFDRFFVLLDEFLQRDLATITIQQTEAVLEPA